MLPIIAVRVTGSFCMWKAGTRTSILHAFDHSVRLLHASSTTQLGIEWGKYSSAAAKYFGVFSFNGKGNAKRFSILFTFSSFLLD